MNFRKIVSYDVVLPLRRSQANTYQVSKQLVMSFPQKCIEDLYSDVKLKVTFSNKRQTMWSVLCKLKSYVGKDPLKNLIYDSLVNRAKKVVTNDLSKFENPVLDLHTMKGDSKLQLKIIHYFFNQREVLEDSQGGCFNIHPAALETLSRYAVQFTDVPVQILIHLAMRENGYSKNESPTSNDLISWIDDYPQDTDSREITKTFYLGLLTEFSEKYSKELVFTFVKTPLKEDMNAREALNESIKTSVPIQLELARLIYQKEFVCDMSMMSHLSDFTDVNAQDILMDAICAERFGKDYTTRLTLAENLPSFISEDAQEKLAAAIYIKLFGSEPAVLIALISHLPSFISDVAQNILSDVIYQKKFGQDPSVLKALALRLPKFTTESAQLKLATSFNECKFGKNAEVLAVFASNVPKFTSERAESLFRYAISEGKLGTSLSDKRHS